MAQLDDLIGSLAVDTGEIDAALDRAATAFVRLGRAIIDPDEREALEDAVEVLEELVADYEDDASDDSEYVAGLEAALRKANESRRALAEDLELLAADYELYTGNEAHVEEVLAAYGQ